MYDLDVLIRQGDQLYEVKAWLEDFAEVLEQASFIGFCTLTAEY